ncbi:MAG TPA: cyclase family protein [Spirochaetia bacterium]|nr:cyclase family protein [Spirochaetia bacterium]
MGKMRLVDLTHPWGYGTPIWPAGEEFSIQKVQYMSKANRLTQLFFGLCMHIGTHSDSPAHVVQGGAYTDELALENFYGTAVVVDIPKGKWEIITPEDLEKATPRIEKGDIVIIHTGSHRHWGHNDDYFMNGPGLSKAAGEWLVQKGIKALGVDMQALDHPCATYMIDHGVGPFVPRLIEEYKKETGRSPKEDHPDWEPVHTLLLSNNIMGFENVGGDIEMVVGKRCTISAFPLRWYQGDGSMVRMVAFIDEDEINPGVGTRQYKYGTF